MRKLFAALFIFLAVFNIHAQKITVDSVLQKVAKGKPFTLVLLKTNAALPADKETANKIQMEHLVHLFQMEKDGKISVFGPVTTDTTLSGIIIFNTTDQEAIKKELDNDPFVKNGFLKYEMYGWFSIPGQKIPSL